MPLYEYQCDACGKRFEVIQKYSDPPADVCKLCGGTPVKRLMSSPAFQFKGSGWYVTDYAQKSSSAASSSSSKPEAAAGESAKADTPAPASTATTPAKE